MLIFALLSLSFAACSHKDFSMCSSNSQAVSWDYVLHVQTWAGQFCYSNCCDLPTYTMDIHPGFTMHGWWPNFISGYPSCCKTDLKDSDVTNLIESDSSFKENLAYYWPSLTKCKFFQYEYDKHGTCISDVYSGSNGPKDYANAAIKLMKSHDMWQVFQANGVVADGTTKHSKSWLKELVANEIGVEGAVYFTCSSSKYLSEMRLCTTVTSSTKSSPQFIACPSGVISGAETCGDNIIFENVPDLTDGGCEY